ncbi:MAG TPA: amidase [Terriglobales bacterium]|nr:amidase [Terriglobales bacterium]
MREESLTAVATSIRARTLSPVEAVERCLERVRKWDGRIRAFIRLDEEGARESARKLEAEAAAGRWRGPLHGVPVAFKDLCHLRGLPTSCGTAMPGYFASAQDCTAARRLLDAGAISLGKLNMTELALGAFGDNAHHGDAENPWRAGHGTGGSSSGSGAGLAAGFFLGTVGSDTGGSIRLPAACCGVVGLKPTYGRVSRAGAMVLSWSMDHLGPLAWTSRDVALLLQEMAGRDPADATASRRAVPDYLAGIDRGITGVRVGLPENYFFQGVDGETAAGVRRAARQLEDLGARVSEIRIPDPQHMTDVAMLIARAESAALHADVLRNHPEMLQPTVRGRLEVGLGVAAYDYLQALRLRAKLTRAFIGEVFDEIDVLLTPVIPEPAPALAPLKATPVEEFNIRSGRFSRLTRPFNGYGLPALSVPCGFTTEGLPMAFQAVGRPFDEGLLLRLGHAYQEAAGWHLRRPTL